MTLAVTYKCVRLLGLGGLSRHSRFAAGLLLAVVWSQLFIGAYTIWEGVPIHLASTHQTGAMTVLSAFLFAMHTCRKVDPRHLKNLLVKLRAEDPQSFHNMMMA
ncbi:MAG: hypothetical protein ACK55I_50370, partial [bacterium]